MTDRGAEVDRGPSPRADVCIVGAGVAGALVANELADRGHEVVVLEAGERFPGPGERFSQLETAIRPTHSISDVWNVGGRRDRYTTTGDIIYPLNELRVKGVGGTTLHWGGYTPRMHERDFEMRTRYGLASDWPISYADLRPYYATAEEELGVAGADDNPYIERETPFPLPPFPPSHTDALFAEACDELGIAMHSLPQARNPEEYDGRSQCVGYSTCSPVCPSGAKYSGDVHVRKAEAKGVRVIDRASVQSLEHGDDPSTVEAAVYATPDGRTHRQEARQFVVACGAVETPRLLFLSRSDAHPDGLANASGAVGRYLMDHVSTGMTAILDGPGNPMPMGYNTSQTQQFYENDSAGSIMMVFDNSNAVSLPKLALRGGDDRKLDVAMDPLRGDLWGDELLDALRDRITEKRSAVPIVSLVETLPRKENRVTLDASKTDDHGNPVPSINWGVGDFERRTRERAWEIERKIFEAMGGRVVWQGPEVPSPTGHSMGTTRMGTDPATSVVDPRLRCHDVPNLRIVSSGVFVTGGAVNPTLTIAALALRAAEHLHEDL